MSLGGLIADPKLIAEQTARILLEIKAVNFSAEKPFIFTSGWASPVYIDVRKLIFYPRIRGVIIDFAAGTIMRDIGYEQIDVVAGGETAGIPYAAWVADRLMLPMQYIRKKPKGFGRNAQIEGDIREGARTLLVEDLTTDGRSKLNFCQALRDAGAVVDHTFVVFHYGIFPQSLKTMKEIGVTLHALCTWWDVLAIAKKRKYFERATLKTVEKFLNDPVAWSVAHGGAGKMGD
jgi:orotate phosphoribosyltransferase